MTFSKTTGQNFFITYIYQQIPHPAGGKIGVSLVFGISGTLWLQPDTLFLVIEQPIVRALLSVHTNFMFFSYSVGDLLDGVCTCWNYSDHCGDGF